MREVISQACATDIDNVRKNAIADIDGRGSSPVCYLPERSRKIKIILPDFYALADGRMFERPNAQNFYWAIRE